MTSGASLNKVVFSKTLNDQFKKKFINFIFAQCVHKLKVLWKFWHFFTSSIYFYFFLYHYVYHNKFNGVKIVNSCSLMNTIISDVSFKSVWEKIFSLETGSAKQAILKSLLHSELC